jgi:hypothetical protein
MESGSRRPKAGAGGKGGDPRRLEESGDFLSVCNVYAKHTDRVRWHMATEKKILYSQKEPLFLEATSFYKTVVCASQYDLCYGLLVWKKKPFRTFQFLFLIFSRNPPGAKFRIYFVTEMKPWIQKRNKSGYGI